MPKKKRKWPSRAKAKLILSEGFARGKKLTRKQRGLLGIIASGKRPTKVKS